MAKNEDRFEVTGKVIECLPGATFKGQLENGRVCTCTLSGKLRVNVIRVIMEDKVTVDLSIKDPKMENGRIVWRCIK